MNNMADLSFHICVLILTLLRTFSFASKDYNLKDIATDQLEIFKEKYEGPIGVLTTRAGEPVSYREARVSLNTRLLVNNYFVEIITHQNRERLPERVVHAKDAGAFGYFQVTCDISDICKAEVFRDVGKKTPVAVRFSPTTIERGGSDLISDNHGFAIKFYTLEGNFDLVGLATPNFVIKDPIKFPSFSHAIKRNPATNLFDNKMLWDFLTLNPEGFFVFLFLFGDRGIPASYANMPGYSIHLYQVENVAGVPYFITFHILPDGGIKNLTTAEALKISDPDYLVRNLYNLIANGKYPSWTVYIQVLTLDDVKKENFVVFDVTRVIPEDKYPLKEIGKMYLNRNPLNYFAEVEQLAYNVANLVPGILGDPGTLFEARRFAYRDAQDYRLGANFNNIPVNCPYRTKTFTYNRDGSPPVLDNEKDIPNYYPNSFYGPVPYMVTDKTQLIDIVESPEPNNFDQASEYYNCLSSDEQSRLISNVLASLPDAAKVSQIRAIEYFTKISPDLGRQIAQGLKMNNKPYQTTYVPTTTYYVKQ